MTAITASSATTLEWRATAAIEPRFDLQAGGEPLASLAFASPYSTLATAETPEGTWTFERPGLLSATIHIREQGADHDLAVFHPGMLAPGHLRFADGVAFRWRHEGLGSRTWSLRGEAGEPLLLLRLESEAAGTPDAFGPRGTVEITPAGRFAPRVPLLAALGWYLILLHQWDQATEDPGGFQGL